MTDEEYSDDGVLVDEEEDEEEEGETAPPSPSIFSPELRAVMHVWNHYKAMKKRRLGSSTDPPAGPGANAPAQQAQRRRKRKSRVLFPSDSRKFLPKQKERSRAKPFLFLFSIIVFLQVLLS